jgi:hypothetical protein
MQAACIALKIYLNSLNDKRPVLVARNVHKSVIAGIILAGLGYRVARTTVARGFRDIHRHKAIQY